MSAEIFDDSSRGQKGQGGVLVNGELNTPVLFRNLNSAVAVLNSLTPATPENVASLAHKYVDTTLDLTTAAAGAVGVDELNHLTVVANQATYALADACGLPR